MTSRALLLLLAAFGCGGATRVRSLAEETPTGQSLVGAWDAQLSLTHPYPLAMSSPAARRICGTMGFVENHRPNRDQDDSSAIGVYDLDLARLGLDWLDDKDFPAALVSASADSGAKITADSIRIILNPGSSERIVLLGRHDVAGIDGEWVAQSARGTASGSFSLRPHVAAQPTC